MPFYCVTCEGIDTNSLLLLPYIYIYIYQSRQRGDVDIPRSIINKTWNPKHIRHGSSFYTARSFFFFYISGIPRRWANAPLDVPLEREPQRERNCIGNRPIRELMEFYISFCRLCDSLSPFPRSVTFSIRLASFAILGRAIYSVEHRHGFELIGGRGGLAPFLLSPFLGIRVTSSSRSFVRKYAPTYLIAKEIIDHSISVLSLLWLLLYAQNILIYTLIYVILKIQIFF